MNSDTLSKYLKPIIAMASQLLPGPCMSHVDTLRMSYGGFRVNLGTIRPRAIILYRNNNNIIIITLHWL